MWVGQKNVRIKPDHGITESNVYAPHFLFARNFSPHFLSPALLRVTFEPSLYLTLKSQTAKSAKSKLYAVALFVRRRTFCLRVTFKPSLYLTEIVVQNIAVFNKNWRAALVARRV